jgi:hypothetical protein
MMTQQHPPMRAEGLDDPGTFKLKVAEWTFAGSDEGGPAAAMYTLIETALCRARHKQVYADPRTMPSVAVFPSRRPLQPI